MAIRDWHVGQLVVFWIGLVIGMFAVSMVLAILASVLITSADLSANVGGGAALVVMVAGLAFGLTVSWKWFGNRKVLPIGDIARPGEVADD